jgi:predicted RNA-binding Zn-ribbon protein involved in translation (DUF1610 family)
MNSKVLEWLSCPICGFDDFDNEDCSSEGLVTCPECNNETEIEISNTSKIASPEELAEVAGISVEDFKRRYRREERKTQANDADEVTETGIEFIKDEEYYRAGGVDFNCPECGSKCEMSCSALGLSDVAYCESCSYEFRRSREPLVDDISDGIVLEERKTERDQYEEYNCEYCEESHQYTKPTDTYSRPEGKIHSLEQVTISCPCGNQVHFNDAKPRETRNCSRCQRGYNLDMTEYQS